MFISQTHLPQVLAPEHYTSQEQFDREIERLFVPGWHCVASLAELPSDGDYVTIELFGHPIIVWRWNGEVHAFLNVCAHRFATLRDQPCGHMDRLHCQYHGWEYDETGNTRKIPDAKSFRPMEKGKFGLTKLRAELCGQAVYVSLAEEGRSLREAMGPGYEIGQRIFGPDRRLFHTLDYTVEANWKVKVENTLESYHIDLVHPKTFGRAPDETICRHELDPAWTTFMADEPAPAAVDRAFNRAMHRLAGVKLNWEYHHRLYYPSLMMMHTGLVSVAETTIPLAPNRTRVIVRLFVYPGKPGTLASKIVYRAFKTFARGYFTKVAGEDAGIMPSIQKGLVSRKHPSTGLISIREERLFHFQEYIHRMTLGAGSSGQAAGFGQKACFDTPGSCGEITTETRRHGEEKRREEFLPANLRE